MVSKHHDEVEEEEKDDVMDEFADNENLDADEYDSKDDY